MRNLITVFDTETTGRTDFKASYNAPHQPNLVQLGYKVYDMNRNVIFETGHLVNTTEFEGFKMEEGAEAVHGISHERVAMYGYKPSYTFKQLQEWLSRTKILVAHNITFDITILQCFAFRLGMNPGFISDIVQYCTMHNTTSLCRIPNDRGGFKWPKLIEAYKTLVDPAGFEGAHDALIDVNACGKVFWKLVDARLVNLDEVA